MKPTDDYADVLVYCDKESDEFVAINQRAHRAMGNVNPRRLAGTASSKLIRDLRLDGLRVKLMDMLTFNALAR